MGSVPSDLGPARSDNCFRSPSRSRPTNQPRQPLRRSVSGFPRDFLCIAGRNLDGSPCSNCLVDCTGSEKNDRTSARLPIMLRFNTGAASPKDDTQDRALVFDIGDASIVCLADGAGGVPGGGEAADMFIDGIQRGVIQSGFDVTAPKAWTTLLNKLDLEIERDARAGETTAIALAITEHGLVGASAGDSQAWLLGDLSWQELTQAQVPKARLGRGRAQARAFTAEGRGTLLVATDGLFHHLGFDDIANILRSESDHTASALVQFLLGRYRQLPDDVAVIVAYLD